MERLVLWDIDHTLISTGGVGRELSALAFRQATGVEMREQAAVEGITEPVIFRETAKLHGLATDRGDFERFAAALTQAHLTHSAQLRERGHALPGAAAALEALAAKSGIRQSVVSGNIGAVARIKLEVFGLDRRIDWEAGGYGDDDDVRSALVTLALTRAAGRSEVLRPENAVVIGDTPADVEAARANSVPAIAVASGRSSQAQLRAAGADVVLPDLADTGRLLDALRQTSGRTNSAVPASSERRSAT
ncbi:HAD family hydrolase [Streptomyces inhibens]|uniref:HAD family hydrolase n=1 Tax=Streptomyces inhibens TaxID=2293571 RepID=A0A371Q8S4_STRIH|nr:haloacid dehalogenase-like hydrolase [Streptomyces inhibens]REK91095.1 HAD family hydrolase [Streptomyces inhibens]